jgi:hypothetical protein
VFDRLIDELGAAVVAALRAAGDDPGDQTRAALRTIVDFVDEDRRRGRVLYVEALGNEALNRRRKEAGHTLVGLVEQAAAGKHGALPPGERIARIGAAILVGGVSELLVEWLEGRIDVTPQQLVDDATDLFLALGEATAAIAARRSRKPRG